MENQDRINELERKLACSEKIAEIRQERIDELKKDLERKDEKIKFLRSLIEDWKELANSK